MEGEGFGDADGDEAVLDCTLLDKSLFRGYSLHSLSDLLWNASVLARPSSNVSEGSVYQQSIFEFFEHLYGVGLSILESATVCIGVKTTGNTNFS